MVGLNCYGVANSAVLGVYRTESVSVMGHIRSAAVRSTGWHLKLVIVCVLICGVSFVADLNDVMMTDVTPQQSQSHQLVTSAPVTSSSTSSSGRSLLACCHH